MQERNTKNRSGRKNNNPTLADELEFLEILVAVHRLRPLQPIIGYETLLEALTARNNREFAFLVCHLLDNLIYYDLDETFAQIYHFLEPYKAFTWIEMLNYFLNLQLKYFEEFPQVSFTFKSL